MYTHFFALCSVAMAALQDGGGHERMNKGARIASDPTDRFATET